MTPRDHLVESFLRAVKAADPRHIIPTHLPHPPKGRTVVVGAGKAAAAMAQAVENAWPADAPLEGLVVTRYGHALPTQRIHVVEAGHPIPDEQGERGSRTILALVEKLRSDDLLLCLLSGGGSSLLALPIDGVSLGDLKDVTHQLLRSGANIQHINIVRKHLSAIQGGRLAAACKAPILALIVSDVTGDDVTHIASGPCSPDPSTFADAFEILRRYEINIPPAVREVLSAGVKGNIDETLKPGASLFDRVDHRIIANARQSLAAAADYFRNLQIMPLILGDTVTGEAREIAKSYAALSKEIHTYPQALKAPIALLSGGETTVTVKGKGRGGRNSEFLLSLLLALDGQEGTYALACDTDGLDGSEDNAGALITPDSALRARKLGLQATAFLNNNDSYAFFQRLNDLVITGPTYTNVNDYRVILVL
ncbi:glycerate kinase [Nitrosomonas sp. JL21]|uniref:glycerate kinase type-2 family protein n=1 Tax=Nitrosomonas sp. JL21 TaxID=153949 RepID=UPI001369EE50|nr:glycerate kinase [Nitrosomonas sp. JL21]MBL8497655.1 glycerate kinase [Nitrosomonas sp.]MXS78886.1 glycerate kinase [Nitrosomonas sp. JL21]